jgi:hypothetical protein
MRVFLLRIVAAKNSMKARGVLGHQRAGTASELLSADALAGKGMPVKTDRKDARSIAQSDAARLVPPGALQIVTGAGSTSTIDSAQAAADQEP